MRRFLRFCAVVAASCLCLPCVSLQATAGDWLGGKYWKNIAGCGRCGGICFAQPMPRFGCCGPFGDGYLDPDTIDPRDPRFYEGDYFSPLLPAPANGSPLTVEEIDIHDARNGAQRPQPRQSPTEDLEDLFGPQSGRPQTRSILQVRGQSPDASGQAAGNESQGAAFRLSDRSTTTMTPAPRPAVRVYQPTTSQPQGASRRTIHRPHMPLLP